MKPLFVSFENIMNTFSLRKASIDLDLRFKYLHMIYKPYRFFNFCLFNQKILFFQKVDFTKGKIKRTFFILAYRILF